jgi:hypothetical protein
MWGNNTTSRWTAENQIIEKWIEAEDDDLDRTVLEPISEFLSWTYCQCHQESFRKRESEILMYTTRMLHEGEPVPEICFGDLETGAIDIMTNQVLTGWVATELHQLGFCEGIN